MIKQFNLISGWASSALVTQVTLDGRVEILKKFIDLMDQLHELNNLNGMMEILSGINNSSVRRMKQTFGALDSDYKKRLEKTEELLSHKFSYKGYRDHLHQINPPCVPYMGVYLTDLTFTMDGNQVFYLFVCLFVCLFVVCLFVCLFVFSLKTPPLFSCLLYHNFLNWFFFLFLRTTSKEASSTSKNDD